MPNPQKERAQRVVDREIAARIELDAAIKARVEERASIVGECDEAVAFIDNYANPAVPNPTPIAPEVAAPAPAVEPPVFTTVDTVELTPATTSGGAAPAIDEDFVQVDQADLDEASGE